MKIKSNLSEEFTILNFVNLIGKRKIILSFLLFFGLSIFCLLSFSYGIYIYKTGQYYPIRMFAHRIIKGDFTFFKNKLISISSELEKFDIDIKFIDLERLRYLRQMALSQNELTNDLQIKVPARLRLRSDEYAISIGLTGQTIESVQHPNIWSLSVRVKNGKTILGMKEFGLLVPLARGYLTDWIAHEMLKPRGVIALRTDFIDVNINGENIGLYCLEERFDKLLIENNHFKEGVIFKNINNELKIYNFNKMRAKPELIEQAAKLKRLWHGFLTEDLRADQLFDLKKFASTAVVTDLMNDKHGIYFSNMRLYFNPITCLIEPIPREWGVMQIEEKRNFGSLLIENPRSINATENHKGLYENLVFRKIFDNLEFAELYIKEANIISAKSYLDSIITAKKKQLNQLIKKIHVQNPFYRFPQNMLFENQKIIREKIKPQLHPIKIKFYFLNNDTLSLVIKNKIELPIEIHGINYNSKNLILPKRTIINAPFKSIFEDQMIDVLLNKKNNFDNFSMTL